MCSNRRLLFPWPSPLQYWLFSPSLGMFRIYIALDICGYHERTHRGWRCLGTALGGGVRGSVGTFPHTETGGGIKGKGQPLDHAQAVVGLPCHSIYELVASFGDHSNPLKS